MPRFAQLVVGPPGAGKTTYCNGMQQFLTQLGRDVTVVNLDPANDSVPYDLGVDVGELVCLDDVMREHSLGPNGGLVFCLEYLEVNFDWLKTQLESLGRDTYVLFDCPGQVELYTHHHSMKRITERLEKELDYRLAAVTLIDAHHCSDAAKFISATLLSLTTMLRLELPQVNVLSKLDLVEAYGPLPFHLDFFTEVGDLKPLLSYVGNPVRTGDASGSGSDEDGDGEGLVAELREEARAAAGEAPPAGAGAPEEPEEPPEAEAELPGRAVFHERYRALNERMCDLVEEFALVAFSTLHIEDPESVARVAAKVDKANGYVFEGTRDPNRGDAALFDLAATEREWNFERNATAQALYTTAYNS